MEDAERPVLEAPGLRTDRASRRSPRALGLRFLPLAAVLAALALGYALGLHRYLSLEALREYQAALSAFVDDNVALAALAYVCVYVAAVALSFPGASALTAAGGLMFGALAGSALALLSATIGATCIFLIARTSLEEVLEARAGPRVQRLREGFQEEGFGYLLFLRLVPMFPFWLVNLAAALFGVRFLPFVAATAIGIVPGTLLLAYVGEGLGSAVDGDMPERWAEVLAGRFALLGLVVLIAIFIRRWRRQSRSG
jgi:uncharacterized membrane protein YdjX (TVP38/TMEM64 family)